MQLCRKWQNGWANELWKRTGCGKKNERQPKPPLPCHIKPYRGRAGAYPATPDQAQPDRATF